MSSVGSAFPLRARFVRICVLVGLFSLLEYVAAFPCASQAPPPINRTPGGDNAYYFGNMPEWTDMSGFLEFAMCDLSPTMKTGQGYEFVKYKDSSPGSHDSCTVVTFRSIITGGNDIGVIYFDGHGTAETFHGGTLCVERRPYTSQGLQDSRTALGTYATPGGGGYVVSEVGGSSTAELVLLTTTKNDGWYIGVTPRFFDKVLSGGGDLNKALVLLNSSFGLHADSQIDDKLLEKGAMTVVGFDISPPVNHWWYGDVGFQEFFKLLDNLCGGHPVLPLPHRQLWKAMEPTILKRIGNPDVTLAPAVREVTHHRDQEELELGSPVEFDDLFKFHFDTECDENVPALAVATGGTNCGEPLITIPFTVAFDSWEDDHTAVFRTVSPPEECPVTPVVPLQIDAEYYIELRWSSIKSRHNESRLDGNKCPWFPYVWDDGFRQAVLPNRDDFVFDHLHLFLGDPANNDCP